MSPLGVIRAACAKRFPRVSGDEPGKLLLNAPSDAFSPRERG